MIFNLTYYKLSGGPFSFFCADFSKASFCVSVVIVIFQASFIGWASFSSLSIYLAVTKKKYYFVVIICLHSCDSTFSIDPIH